MQFVSFDLSHQIVVDLIAFGMFLLALMMRKLKAQYRDVGFGIGESSTC